MLQASFMLRVNTLLKPINGHSNGVEIQNMGLRRGKNLNKTDDLTGKGLHPSVSRKKYGTNDGLNIVIFTSRVVVLSS